MAKARYIMIGGFLGAGKTTAILQLAQKLHGQGTRVGLITNDQSFGLGGDALDFGERSFNDADTQIVHRGRPLPRQGKIC